MMSPPHQHMTVRRHHVKCLSTLITCIFPHQPVLIGLFPHHKHNIKSLLLTVSSSGPISSILVNRFGSRPIIIFGGCLAGSGLVAASFCNTVEQLYLFIGVVGGERPMPDSPAEFESGRNSEHVFLLYLHIPCSRGQCH